MLCGDTPQLSRRAPAGRLGVSAAPPHPPFAPTTLQWWGGLPEAHRKRGVSAGGARCQTQRVLHVARGGVPSVPGERMGPEGLDGSVAAGTLLLCSCLQLPPPSGPTPDPGPHPAVAATPVSALPAQPPHGEGGAPRPVPRAAGPSPPCELRSPARILAFHRELRRSIHSSSRAHKSPLEL